jgi:protein SCO1/2
MRVASGSVRSFVLLLFGAVVAGSLAGYLAGGGSRGRAPAASDASSDAAGAGAPAGPAFEEAGEAAGEAGNPFAGFRVGDFELTGVDGGAVDQTLFEGEVTVLTFFFTSCNGPCPAIARVMKEVQDLTVNSDAGRRLRFASISVDGARDTPAVIGSFAESYGADPGRWVFMTGDPGAVRDLVRESIGFELREQEGVLVPGPDGAMMNNILHPTRLLLVGPDRTLIGVYPFNDPDAVTQMVRDALNVVS